MKQTAPPAPLLLATLLLAAFVAAGTPTPAQAQDIPRISGVFPAGAQAGKTVEISVRGSALLGAKRVWVSAPGGVIESGFAAEITSGAANVDAAAKPLFQTKCAGCHELRSPGNRSYSPEQWKEIVERMVKAHSAPVAAPEAATITGYLQALTRAGEIKARVSVPAGAVPGRRELRVLTANGVSTAATFEVGSLPEVVSLGGKTSAQSPQPITLPAVINGTLAQSGQRDYFSFAAKKGERVTLNLEDYRLSEPAQAFSNPVLYLYDAAGAVVAKSLGRGGAFGSDPALDWTAVADGTYTLLVRDLLYHGNPVAHYRLAAGDNLPLDVRFVSQTVARPGALLTPTLAATIPLSPTLARASVSVPAGTPGGIINQPTPAGDAPFFVSDAPDGGAPLTGDPAKAAAVPLPAVFHGIIYLPNSVKDVRACNVFKIKTTRANVPIYFTSASLGSPLRAWIQVFKPSGEYVTGYYGDHATDFRFDNAFPTPGEYVVHVMDGGNNAGADFSYVWEAAGDAPEFALSATPDAVNLAPGGSAAITVRATRRENIAGALTITARDLPPGVTALPCVLPPDDDKATLILRADGAAKPSAGAVRIEGTYTGAGGTAVTRSAVPLDVYRINNGAYHFVRRNLCAVAVAESDPSPPVTLEVENAPAGIALPFDRETEIKIKVTRREGFKSDFVIVPLNFPPGISTRGNTYIPADKNELVFSLYADGNARFLRGERPAKNLPPMTVVFAIRAASGGEFDYLGCTVPVALSLKVGVVEGAKK